MITPALMRNMKFPPEIEGVTFQDKPFLPGKIIPLYIKKDSQ